MHVLYLQAQCLPHPHARFVQQREQQAVAQRLSGDSGQNRLHLLFSQRTRVTLADGDGFQLGGGIGRYQILLVRPPEIGQT